MTKRGSLDNVVTYEYYCDTVDDLVNIPQEHITLGSVAIVLKDKENEISIYIADSNKQWHSFSIGNSEGGNDVSNISLANLLDINLKNPTDGQTLIYNGETQQWENQENSYINNDIVIIKVTEINDYQAAAIDKTYEEITEYAKNNKLMMLVYPDDWDNQPAYYINLSTQGHVFMRTTIGFNLGGITINYDYTVIRPDGTINNYTKTYT